MKQQEFKKKSEGVKKGEREKEGGRERRNSGLVFISVALSKLVN